MVIELDLTKVSKRMSCEKMSIRICLNLQIWPTYSKVPDRSVGPNKRGKKTTYTQYLSIRKESPLNFTIIRHE